MATSNKKYNKEMVKLEVNNLIDKHDICKYEVTRTVEAGSITMIRVIIDLPYIDTAEKIIV